MNNRHTFGKNERLKSRKLIEHLFRKGRSMSAFPVKILFDFVEDERVGLKAGVTVSSRNFKKAVERNRVKRVLRESYRLQKQPLQEYTIKLNRSLIVFFIYTGKELPVSKDVYEKVGTLLQRLLETTLNDQKKS